MKEKKGVVVVAFGFLLSNIFWHPQIEARRHEAGTLF